MAVTRQPVVQVRQGDVLLTPITNIGPVEAERIKQEGRNLLNVAGDAVLATGKGGGHPHAVIGRGLAFVETRNSAVMRQQPDDVVSRLLIVGDDGATLEHDEHEAIELPPNTMYVVFRQLETLVGDENVPEQHMTTGIKANDRDQPSRRYVED